MTSQALTDTELQAIALSIGLFSTNWEATCLDIGIKNYNCTIRYDVWDEDYNTLEEALEQFKAEMEYALAVSPYKPDTKPTRVLQMEELAEELNIPFMSI